jgi:predicted transcriptional regulator/transcriptional regulator with XRE-family HTH domain
MDRAPVGFRIRSARKALGLTQAELAKRAGISPSYLNLIEANKRQIGGALLKKIASLLDIETDALTGRAEQRMIADLREVALEPLLRHIDLSPDLAPDLVGRHPDWTRALLTLYRAWRDQTAIANALSDRLNQDPVLANAIHQMLSHVTAIRSSLEILDDVPELDDVQRRRFHEIISMESHRLSETTPLLAALFDQSGTVFKAATPAHEVDDFMLQHNAWFPLLEQVGNESRQDVMRYGGTDEASLTEYLRSRHATTVAQLSSDGHKAGGFRNFTRVDSEARQITFLANAPRSTRRFQLARQIARVEAAAAIETELQDPLLTSDTARDRARSALSSYVASVLVFPYTEFMRSVTECRYDIEILCQRYDASYEQICHRLITLRDPDLPGVPFAFLRSDPAGFMTKRFPLPGLPLLRGGHACPLWAIFNSYQTPNRTIRRLVEVPSGARYLMIAQAVTKQPASFHEAPFLQSVMLICDVRHADRTVYADGLDLSSTQAATPVGPGCRLCPRSDCRFRNEDQIVGSAMTSRS